MLSLRRAFRSPVLIALVPLIVAFAPALDDEVLKEFKKYFRKYKESAPRVEAILALEDVESPEVVKVLTKILKDDDQDVVDACVRVLGGFETRPPVDALLLQIEGQKNEAIRLGFLRAWAIGGYLESGEAILACLQDKSWEVRRRGLQALLPEGDVHVPAIALLTADSEPAVRSAALEALTVLKSEAVLEPARTALSDDTWQVRASALAALGVVRDRDSIAPLIERLKIEEGRLQQDVADALESLTLRSFGLRIELWERFWESNQSRYKIPTDEEVAALRARQKESAKQYEKGAAAVSYHGIETPSRSILFVIDVSGSMENEVIEREKFVDGEYPSMQRMDIVKTELARTIENLEPYVKFNILAFATDLNSWKKDLVSANVLNKSSAADWIKRLEPLGGNSKQDLAEVGLAGAASLESGKTNTFGALAWALALDAEGDPTDDYETEVDTIFFLSDGRPTTGRYINPDDILREILEANALRKIVLHTIAIGEFQKSFMRELSEGSGGVFVDLGR